VCDIKIERDNMSKADELIFMMVCTVGIAIYGFAFLELGKHKKRLFFVDIDKIMFPKLKNNTILIKASQISCIICEIMASLILVNGLLSYFFNIENVSMIFIIIALSTLLIRPIYIYYTLKKIG